MKVKVELFSELRLMLGKQIELEIAKGSTVKEALEAFYDRFGDSLKFKIVDANTNHYQMAFSVNNQLSNETIVLKEGDTLAIIPPVAGG